MDDFEVNLKGTAARNEKLETENERLREALYAVMNVEIDPDTNKPTDGCDDEATSMYFIAHNALAALEESDA